MTSDPRGVIDDVPGYHDLTELGRGALATTYRARPEVGEELVAIKVLHGDLADVPTRKAMARYRRDAERLAGQQDVLQVLDSGTTYTGQPYVVTPYCAGGSVLDRLARGGQASIEDVLAVGVLVALALHGAHRLGLWHGSVKPSNILFDAEDRPLLSDFVTAALRADRLLQLAGPAPQHTAPELLSGAEPGPRTDVYSLAATLYHMLCGRAPYPDRGGVAGLLISTMTEPAPPVTRAEVPESLRAALARAMTVEPDARTSDALAFAQQLHATLPDLGIPAPYLDSVWSASGGAPAGSTDTAARSTDMPSTETGTSRASAGIASPPRDADAVAELDPPHATSSLGDRTEPASPAERGRAPAGRATTDEPPATDVDVGAETAAEAADPEADVPSPDPGSDAAASAAADARPRNRLGAALAGAGLLVVVMLAGVGWLVADRGVAGPVRDRAGPVATHATERTVGRPADATQLAALAPADLTAKDSGAAVSLHWTLPTAATGASLVLQQQPASPGQSQLTILEAGRTSHPVTGLDPATAYCFRVGVLVSVGSVGKPATVAWSEPAGVRGACAVASPAPTPS